MMVGGFILLYASKPQVWTKPLYKIYVLSFFHTSKTREDLVKKHN
jgi:hypothetical protein